MNVWELIQQIKIRPEIFIGELDIVSMFHFINGFLYNNISTNRADKFDLAFKNEFHSWVKEKLKKSMNMDFNVERNYIFYLNQAFRNSNHKIEIFFEWCDEFFSEIE